MKLVGRDDVIVAGAGMAGLSAAATAPESGANVLVPGNLSLSLVFRPIAGGSVARYALEGK
jgi:succinate dehydrogenase/fumarate reductase flavoprotein subunit